MAHATRTALGWGAVFGLLAACASGCSSAGPDLGSSSGAIGASVSWTTVGYGVGGATVGSGNNILIVYGGYSATDIDSRDLALALNGSASFSDLNVGSIYASRGPDTASYSNREIGNFEVCLLNRARKMAAADYVIVIAHSSGAFVADELFTEATDAILGKIVYFALDGGTWALDDALIAKMKAVSFVYGKDSAKGDSENASAMMSLHEDFSASHLFMVDADGSGCNVGAGWCLHDTLITTRPHNPSTYDLDDDYTDFTGTGRHVVTSYVDQAVADGIIQPSASAPPPSNDAGSAPPPHMDASAPPPPKDAGTISEDAGYGSCEVPSTGESGPCIDTAACASLGGTSTPHLCPGPTNIECCTGIPQ